MQPGGVKNGIPSWFPVWARELARAYYAGNASMFVLHGNVDDLYQARQASGAPEYVGLTRFLSEQVFGTWDLVLLYDQARPPRALAGKDQGRLQTMNGLIERHMGPVDALPRDPTRALTLIDRFLELMLVGRRDQRRPSVAVVLDYAQLLLPRTSVAHTAQALAANLVTVLNWAKSPYFRQVNFAFVLIAEKLSDLHLSVAHSGHTRRVELPYPQEEQRRSYFSAACSKEEMGALSVVSADLLAKMTAGLTLVHLQGMLQAARRHQQSISLAGLKAYKKEMIENACDGLVEFIEPEHDLEMVVGHQAAKRRLKDDATLIAQNHLDAVPMGYLLCGPVGTGKSFMAQCYAGTVGIPCLKLLNFRSKYVGETEGNLEKILKVLRVMGPVLVMIDEADAALGDRDQQGDSGTSSRVFAQIAAQMGDTRYRGKIIWFLMTARPDLLPIDIKRQGRAEVHVALFYPDGPDDLQQMFVVMGRKHGLDLRRDDIPELGPAKLSGADVEGVVTRARRRALLNGRTRVKKEDLASALQGFIPSAADAEKQMQELAAILECTDAEMLPQKLREQVRTPEGKAAILRQFELLRAQVEQH